MNKSKRDGENRQFSWFCSSSGPQNRNKRKRKYKILLGPCQRTKKNLRNMKVMMRPIIAEMGTEKAGNQRKNRDHPDRSIAVNDSYNEKSTGKLRILCWYSYLRERSRTNSRVKKEYNNNNNISQNNTIRTNNVKAKIDTTQQSCRSRLCGNRDETISLIISECSKLAQEEYKIRNDWVGKLIHWKLCKKFKIYHTNKWYMHNPESVLENGMH